MGEGTLKKNDSKGVQWNSELQIFIPILLMLEPVSDSFKNLCSSEGSEILNSN